MRARSLSTTQSARSRRVDLFAPSKQGWFRRCELVNQAVRDQGLRPTMRKTGYRRVTPSAAGLRISEASRWRTPVKPAR